jgi:MSHA biogenesis protein MshP
MKPVTQRRFQRGFSLVSAIFLLVVLAGLGVYSVRITVMQQQTVTAAMRAAQAFHAARAGIEWGARRALEDGWCGAQTLNLTEGGTNGFSVAVSCAQSTHVEGEDAVNVFVFDVRAEAGAYGGPDYVSRRLQAKILETV